MATCPVCLQLFNTRDRAPHVLLCGHEYCAACLETLLEGGAIVCPQDRAETRTASVANLPHGPSLAAKGTACELRDEDEHAVSLADGPPLTSPAAAPKCTTHNEDVKVFGGGFVRSLSREGSEQGQFNHPFFVALLEDVLWVTDFNNHRIQALRMSTGECTASIGGVGEHEGKLNSPTGIAIAHTAGQMFVSESRNSRISVFSLSGAFLYCFGQGGYGKIGEGELYNPRGVCLDPGERELFVCDTWNSRIQVYSLEGKFLRMWGSEGSGQGQLKYPWDVKVSVSGAEVFVADTYNHRVCVFRPDGAILRVLGGGQGSGDGQLSFPSGLALTSWSTVLVCEGTDYLGNGNHRVSELRERDGGFVCKWEGRGSGDGEFNNPCGVVVNQKGEVFVCDSGNHRIQVFA